MRKGSKHKLNYRGSPEERFWKYVTKTDYCWNWIGAVTEKRKGDGHYYGLIRIDRKPIKAHRFSYELHLGKIPKGLFVCHKCDNPSCVNPDHLFIGTNKDNVDDMVSKMRQTYGGKNPMAKLTEDDVITMRFLKKQNWALPKIASKFNIALSTASQIVNNKRWKHI